ncbi:hypothetical protein SSPO_003740 [Streptomyces antimycoticus]|uniref:Uncharacterized protein n=1 Tax=Streptomyces antimycoticus TaxID=68175 RepID=A0A499ULK8_9ACTN|nr:hypothetical protein SSPO_003740 [Streptomyces antimycoticus]
MAAVVSRWVLGVCAVLAVVGGAAMVVGGFVYFNADEYVPEYTEYGGWGTVAGTCALAIYVGGAMCTHLLMRIGTGMVLAGAAWPVSTSIASLISLQADRGGPRGTLEDSALGFIWLLAGAYFTWRVAADRWPVTQHPLNEDSTTSHHANGTPPREPTSLRAGQSGY